MKQQMRPRSTTKNDSHNHNNKEERASEGSTQASDINQLNAEQAKIGEWLKKIKFKKTLFGGVKESDVWEKIFDLNQKYELALIAERARYDALLKERMADEASRES